MIQANPTPPLPDVTAGTVVIAGGSIAGLLAAAAAAPFAERVVVLDRDHVPDRAGGRPGTPQAPHSHGLLASGRQAMEELLPGLTDRLVERGALAGRDLGSTGRWWIGGGLIADCTVGASGLAVSRAAVEHAVRDLVRELPQVEILDRTDVSGLCGDAHRVTGVSLRPRRVGDPSRKLAADLVIDATGRASRGRRWLAGLGVPEPAEERIRIGLRYTTFHVVAVGPDLGGRAVVVSAATRERPCGAVAIRQEDSTWTITLFAYGEVAPPVDPEGIRRFAATIVSPDVAALLTDRDPLEDPLTYRFPDCRRHPPVAAALPAGFAAIGDSLCSFDPTFGQGMSVAALEALALRDALARGPAAVRRDYPEAAGRIVDGTWALVQGAVLELPDTVGVVPRGHALISRYIHRVQRVARHDPQVAASFLRVTNLMAPPQSLFRPGTARRVLRPGATTSPPVSRVRATTGVV